MGTGISEISEGRRILSCEILRMKEQIGVGLDAIQKTVAWLLVN